MPKYHYGSGHNFQRDPTPAKQLREAAAGHGVFRCDRCDRVLPEHLAIEQDGYTKCSTLCRDQTSRTEQGIALAEQMAVVDSYEPCADPPSSCFSGAVSITSEPTWPVHLVSGGASVALAFEGVGFTSDIAISYSNAGITDNTAPVITSTTIDLDLVAAGVSAGYYNITIAGTTLRRVLQVT